MWIMRDRRWQEDHILRETDIAAAQEGIDNLAGSAIKASYLIGASTDVEVQICSESDADGLPVVKPIRTHKGIQVRARLPFKPLDRFGSVTADVVFAIWTETEAIRVSVAIEYQEVAKIGPGFAIVPLDASTGNACDEQVAIGCKHEEAGLIETSATCRYEGIDVRSRLPIVTPHFPRIKAAHIEIPIGTEGHAVRRTQPTGNVFRDKCIHKLSGYTIEPMYGL